MALYEWLHAARGHECCHYAENYYVVKLSGIRLCVTEPVSLLLAAESFTLLFLLSLVSIFPLINLGISFE